MSQAAACAPPRLGMPPRAGWTDLHVEGCKCICQCGNQGSLPAMGVQRRSRAWRLACTHTKPFGRVLASATARVQHG
eukprot:357613-Chlamydomonas_euryale.AAC.4